VAVPSPLSMKVTPPGRFEVPMDRPMGVLPVAETVNAPGIPTVNVVVFGEVMVGGVLTTSSMVAVWVLVSPVPVTEIVYVPGIVPAAGVITRFEDAPELSDWGVNDEVAPAGSPVAPRPIVCDRPSVSVVVTVMLVGEPARAEVDAGTPIEKSLGSALTTRVKFCVPGVPAPDALIVNAYEPLEPTAGVPASVAVPSPLSVKVTPPGRGELPIDSDGVGTPVVVTVKVPGAPSVNVVVVAEETVAGVSTVREKVDACEVAVPVPVTVIG